MARTKASVGNKVTSVKSSKARAAALPPPLPSSKRKGGKSRSSLAGCNPAHPRDTPDWQLPITRFFQNKNSTTTDNSGISGMTSDESNYKTERTEFVEQGSSQTPDNVDSSDESDNEIESKPESSEQVFKKRKINVIESDDDCAIYDSSTGQAAESSILDTSVDLPPLDGESSHKIAEYFPKAVEKSPRKVIGKENIDKNVEYSPKRRSEEEGIVNKKVKYSD